MTGLSLKNICKSFGDLEVIRNVNLSIDPGELVVFVGPSGCGKSTLLRMIAGLEDITSGEFWIGDKRADHLPASERDIAMVFQSYALYPHMTLAENIGFPLKLAKLPAGKIRQKVKTIADTLHLDELLDRKPGNISGGQRQRVAIGRALARDPKVILLDEPLSNLDAALRLEMRAELARLHKQLASTMIYVTHDQVEAMTLADRIVIFDKGEIAQIGSPLDLYNRPANTFVAEFIGSPKMNLFPASLHQTDRNKAKIRLKNTTYDLDTDGLTGDILDTAITKNRGETIKLGIRPEHLHFSSEGGLRGEIRNIEHLGSDTYIHIETEAKADVVVRSNGISALRNGETVGLIPGPGMGHIFDQQGIRVT
ncbi:ABC transporter ATP-binding protein [Kiloniella laminariae]|uniref:ABC transporter ATP-binding protein n=1 Tax=Kiloniella laminariae TaxID=454162 RepID=UPI00037C0023|nr:sn-glycerol-3-phosphate ABC transporter ATP-binding protein UgpC [Kiloniella laminariae]